MSNLRYMILAGPTAAGKTELAIRLAQELQTEIVGGDAFQLYQGLDILTGKPNPSQLAAVRHYLVGILPLSETCDAHKYALVAGETIAALNKRGVIPLVVGGTGFYLEALEDGLPQLPPVNFALREELNRVSTPDLLRNLRTRDPLASNRIDPHNRRRIIRALEVCISSGKPFSGFLRKSSPGSAIPRIFLERPRAVLLERINRRVDEMFERGVVAEVAGVGEIGSTAERAIGFQSIRLLLSGVIDDSSCRRAIQQKTRDYAKRQMTWFRRRPYEFVDPDSGFELLASIYRRQFAEFVST